MLAFTCISVSAVELTDRAIVSRLESEDNRIVYQTLKQLARGGYSSPLIDKKLKSMLKDLEGHNYLTSPILMALSASGNDNNLDALLKLTKSNSATERENACKSVANLLSQDRQAAAFKRAFSYRTENTTILPLLVAGLWFEGGSLVDASLRALDKQYRLDAQTYEGFLSFLTFRLIELPPTCVRKEALNSVALMISLIHKNGSRDDVETLQRLRVHFEQLNIDGSATVFDSFDAAISELNTRDARLTPDSPSKLVSMLEAALSEERADLERLQAIIAIAHLGTNSVALREKVRLQLADFLTKPPSYNSTGVHWLEAVISFGDLTDKTVLDGIRQLRGSERGKYIKYVKRAHLNYSQINSYYYWYGLFESLSGLNYGNASETLAFLYAVSPRPALSNAGTAWLRALRYRNKNGLDSLAEALLLRHSNQAYLRDEEINSARQQMTLLCELGGERYLNVFSRLSNAGAAKEIRNAANSCRVFIKQVLKERSLRKEKVYSF